MMQNINSNGTGAEETVLNDNRQRKLAGEIGKKAARVKEGDLEKVLKGIPDKVSKVVDSAAVHIPFVSKLLLNVRTLYHMVRDKNFHMETGSKAILIASLAYFISPVDLFPDFVPLVGYIDDAFVISLVLHQLDAEIQRYLAFIKPVAPLSAKANPPDTTAV